MNHCCQKVFGGDVNFLFGPSSMLQLVVFLLYSCAMLGSCIYYFTIYKKSVHFESLPEF